MPDFPTIEETKARRSKQETWNQKQFDKSRRQLPYAIGLLVCVAAGALVASFVFAPWQTLGLCAVLAVLSSLVWAWSVLSDYAYFKDRS